jgi:anti-sigma factor RsiW
MNCDQVREDLGAWIDGELEPFEAKGMEAHLDACPACQGEAEEIRQLEGVLREQLLSPRPPDWDAYWGGVVRHHTK